MRLTLKTLILLLIVVSNYNAFSQEKNIVTKFNQDGGLYKSFDQSSKPITNFKEDEKCIIISYLGNYIYKVKYKEWEGFVKDQFLIINEDMMDLFFANEEKERLKAIATTENRQKKIRNKITAEDKKQKRLDSITKVKEEQKKKELEALEIAKEYQKLLNQQKIQDSITKVEEEKKVQNIALENAKFKQDQIHKRRREDSIVKAKNIQKIRAQNIEFDRLQKLKAIQKTKDSIQKIKNAEIEAKKLAEQKKLDSIAKVENLRKIRDSLNKVKEEEKRQIALLQYQKRKQDQLLAEQKKQDSIAKIKEKDPKVLEEIKFRNTCHYLINEYDQYYGRQLLITDKYVIAENLNAELIREGNSVKIHLNTTENLGCASYVPNTRSSARITLENNEVIILYHSGSLDCNDFSLKAKLSEPKMDLLKYSPIKSILFRGTKGSITILDIDYKTFFIDKLKCIE